MAETPETLVDRLTLAEQVALLSGADFWSLPSIPRLNIGALRMSDGPNGARGSGSLVGGVSAAAFPVGIALGASWDPALVSDVAGAIAEEMRSKGAQVALGPTINLQRTPLNGRNFECHSEDPELAAALAVAYVRGLQAKGIAATPKHFAGNESEIERTTVDSRIDEETLRTMYLRPFEAAVRQGGAWAVMTSYNRLNGTYSAENTWLLRDVLRGDWGFDGAVISDWFGSRSMAPTLAAGLDIEMPGPSRDRGAALVTAVEAGTIPAPLIRDRALAVLRLMARTGVLDGPRPHAERAEDRPEHRALIRRAGAAGMVLLKNDGLLPLAAPGRIAVIGPNAKVAQIMGGGSAQLNPHRRVSPWDGLVARLGEEVLSHAPGCTNHRWEPLIHGAFHVDFHAGPDLQGPVVARQTLDQSTAFWTEPVADGAVSPTDFSARIRGRHRVTTAGRYRLGLHTTGPARLILNGATVIDLREGWTKGRTFFEEGCDEVTVELDLASGQHLDLTLELTARPGDNLQHTAFRFGLGPVLGPEAIAEAARQAADADVALVFAGRSGEWDTEGSDLTDITLPGAQDTLIAAVLAANPNTVIVLQTGGPVAMPWIAAAPAVLQAWYPGQEAGHAIADVLFGAAEPGGRLPQTFPVTLHDSIVGDDPQAYPGVDGAVTYTEGLFTGYRHHDRSGIAPLFPFGHGLSYARFQLADADIGPDRVAVTLRNLSERDGATVVQLYLGHPDPTRPVRQLQAFERVALSAGAETRLTLPLPPRAFARWDAGAGGWRIDAGVYRVEVGFSVADLPVTGLITRSAAYWTADAP
ncbi:glycoside hydrolase family 3 C-terminal domain-containing protein [Cereibacter sphaeroides]|nr:glycoside hydrolase family 3 C-terminal domain-containing protein [Cereibacter sphaeroides]